jgi:hypothetical protein
VVLFKNQLAGWLSFYQKTALIKNNQKSRCTDAGGF